MKLHGTMKYEKTIERRIEKHKKTIERIRSDKNLDTIIKKKAVYKLQLLIRELKWVLNK